MNPYAQPANRKPPVEASFDALTPEQKQAFLSAYSGMAKDNRLDPDWSHPAHQYNYVEAWKAGHMDPDASAHFPSRYKYPGHPRRYLKIDGQLIDTLNDKPVRWGQ
jgi:hypothetical protein